MHECKSLLRSLVRFTAKGPFLNSVTRDAAFFRLEFTSPLRHAPFSSSFGASRCFYCCSRIFSVFWARDTPNFCCSRLRHARTFSWIYPHPLVTRDAIYERPLMQDSHLKAWWKILRRAGRRLFITCEQCAFMCTLKLLKQCRLFKPPPWLLVNCSREILCFRLLGMLKCSILK